MILNTTIFNLKREIDKVCKDNKERIDRICELRTINEANETKIKELEDSTVKNQSQIQNSFFTAQHSSQKFFDIKESKLPSNINIATTVPEQNDFLNISTANKKYDRQKIPQRKESKRRFTNTDAGACLDKSIQVNTQMEDIQLQCEVGGDDESNKSSPHSNKFNPKIIETSTMPFIQFDDNDCIKRSHLGGN